MFNLYLSCRTAFLSARVNRLISSPELHFKTPVFLGRSSDIFVFYLSIYFYVQSLLAVSLGIDNVSPAAILNLLL